MKYTVITPKTAQDLEKTLNQMTQEGWKLITCMESSLFYTVVFGRDEDDIATKN